MYYLPRDCPRACFWPLPSTTPDDLERWYGGVEARMVIAVESAWLDRIRSTTVYRYVMPEAPFTSLDDAGMHATRETVRPLSVDALPDLLGALRDAEVELRVTPNIAGLGRLLVDSSLHFSLIRMRNAQGWDLPQPDAPDLSRVPRA
jgi:hypothetical protein